MDQGNSKAKSARDAAPTVRLTQSSAVSEADVAQRLSALDSAAVLNDIIRALPGVVLRYYRDASGADGIDYVSPSAARIWENSAEAIIADASIVWSQVLPDDLDELAASITESFEKGTLWRARWRITTPSGKRKRLLGRGMPARTKTGAVAWTTIVFDVTDQMLREEETARIRAAAERSERRLLEAIETLPDAFVLFDAQDRMVVCNEQYRQIYPWIADLMEPGVPFEALIRACVERGFQPEAEGRAEEWVAERMAHHRRVESFVEQELPGDRHLQIREKKTPSGDTVGFRVDVTELKRQQNRLRAMASELEDARASAEHDALHDALTGLPNRRNFEAHLSSVATCQPDADVYLLHVDLDHFKAINDTLGHAAGDAALRRASDILRRAVRKEDFVARVGGDEFVVICSEAVSPKDVDAIGARIVTEMSRPMTIEGKTVVMGASIGVANARAADAATLPAHADVALYEAKHRGRGQVAHYTKTSAERREHRRRTADALERSLKNDELFAVFQPIVSMTDGALIGLEAFARWRHPTRGVLRPSEFLGLLRGPEAAERFDRAVWNAVLAAVQSLAERGLSPPPITINVSAARLTSPGLIADAKAARDLGARFVIEIAEGGVEAANLAAVAHAADALRDAGACFSLDQVAGDVSARALQRLQPDRVKLSRPLTASLTAGQDHRALATALVGGASALGAEVCASGVEREDLARAAAEIGCAAAQGHWISEPLPAEDAIGALRSQPWIRSFQASPGIAS